MKDFSGSILAVAKNQLAQMDPLRWLVEVELPTDPATRFRATNSDADISRGTGPTGVPLLYHRFPIAIGDYSTNSKGDFSNLVINVCNVTLELMPYMETYDGLVGQPIDIRLVSLLALTDPNAQIQTNGKIAHCSITQDVISFQLSALNLTRPLFPKNRFLAHHCRWRFGGAECGYTIPVGANNISRAIGGGTGFSICGRTLTECEIRGGDEFAAGIFNADGIVNHPLRFGAEPGIQLQVVR